MTEVAVRVHRPAGAAGDERQGRVPVAGVGADSRVALAPSSPDALVERGAKTVLLVVRDGGKVAEVPVVAGQRIGDLVAVTGEVRSGDKAVVKAPPELVAGTLTRPATRVAPARASDAERAT